MKPHSHRSEANDDWVSGLPAIPAVPPQVPGAFDVAFASAMARLAALAYSRFERDGGAELESLLAPGGLKLEGTFNWQPADREKGRGFLLDRGTQGYVADHAAFAVLVFRGTSDAKDWGTDLALGKRRVPAGNRSARVHAGFLAAYEQTAQRAMALVDQVMARGTKPLYIVGHSLGGALAQIATLVSTRPELAACYTFGSPRVSGSWFRTMLAAPHHRIVDGWDVVPAVPPMLAGYVHTCWCRHLKSDPPATTLTLGRSVLRAMWIDIRGLVGTAFGSDWIGTRDHSIGRYAARLACVAGPPASGARPAE